jgi:type II secretion system protein C
MNRFISLLCIAVIAGCGGAGLESEKSESPLLDMSPASQNEPIASRKSEQPEKPAAEPVKIVKVTRKELNALLDKGPANLLAMVQTDSFRQNGKFYGFEIISFRNGADEILGLKSGDVVTKINGLSIERPEQYFKVFKELRKADHINFEILRNGRKKVLTAPVLP